LSRPCRIIGTISESHGVAIEFRANEKPEVQIRISKQRIEDLVSLKISEAYSDRGLFVVKGANHVIQDLNMITQDFYEKYRKIIDNLTHCANLVPKRVGYFVKIISGDVKLVNCAIAFIQDGLERIRKFDCLWLFASSSSFSPDLAQQLAVDEHRRIISIAAQKIPIYKHRRSLREYNKLLEKTDLTEEQMQIFLKDNWFLLDVYARKVIPKYRLGGKLITDFLVETSDSNYVFVEIENPNSAIYTNEKPPKAARKLREADSQIKNVMSYVRNNILYLRNDLPFISVEKVQGLIMIGRSNKLNKEQREKLIQDNAYAKEYRILTYDDISERVRLLLDNLDIEGSSRG